MSARLTFTNDEAEPVSYDIDNMAAFILDTKREHPEAVVQFGMPVRDRALAVALLRMTLQALEPDSSTEG